MPKRGSEPTERFPLRLAKADYDAYKRASENSGTSMNSLMQTALHTFIEGTVMDNALAANQGTWSSTTTAGTSPSPVWTARSNYAAAVLSGTDPTTVTQTPTLQAAIQALSGASEKEGDEQ